MVPGWRFRIRDGRIGPMKIERPLDEVEVRVLGSLLEKQQSTPDSYPLTLNSLRSACNQATSREPVMHLDDDQIMAAVDKLQELGLVWRVHGSRTNKYEHNLDRVWELSPQMKAIMTLLLLRGAQTPGELRSRGDRLHSLETVSEVESTLRADAESNEPLVRELDRLPGQKEARWMHLVGSAQPAPRAASQELPVTESLTSRVVRLEETVERLHERLRELEDQLGVEREGN